MKKKNIVSILILIGFAVLGAIFLKRHPEGLSRILEIDLIYLIPIFLLVILSSLLRGHKLKMLMELYGLSLKFKEWWCLQMVMQFWNWITPFGAGGFSTRALYFKKKYNFSYTRTVSTVGISYFIDFLVMGLAGAVFSFFLPFQNEVKYSLMALFATFFLGSVFILFFLPPIRIKSNIKMLSHILKSISEFQQIKTKHLLIFKMGLNCVGRVLTTAVQMYFIFLAFNFPVSFYTAIVIVVFTALTTVITITPMNLGFKESVVIVIAKSFGIEAILGAFVVVLDRAVTMVWVFASAPIFSYILSKDFKIKKEEYSAFQKVKQENI